MTSRIPQRPLVVIPAWNEETVIGQVLAELVLLDPTPEVLVVDDGSSDRTAEVAVMSGVEVLRLPFNVGVGGAMRAGLLYAVRHGFDAVVQVDADGQHDPQQVSVLVEALAESDIVVGSRFLGGMSYRVRGPRRWAMWVLARALSFTCRTRLTDVTSGFRSAGPRAIGLLARHYPREYLGDTVESLVVAHKAGLRIGEVGVSMRPRVGGEPSQSPLKAGLYLARASLVLLLATIRAHPRTGSELVT